MATTVVAAQEVDPGGVPVVPVGLADPPSAPERLGPWEAGDPRVAADCSSSSSRVVGAELQAETAKAPRTTKQMELNLFEYARALKGGVIINLQ